LKKIIDHIKKYIKYNIDISVVTGSGLSEIKNILEDPIVINYEDIPGYFNTTVKGHDGAFHFGKFKDKNILIAVGRFHYYEGLTIEEVGLPIKVFNELGCKNIILTNSAGCLQSTWNLGDIMIVSGHYDFTFKNNSQNPEVIKGNKFYSESLILQALKINPKLRQGNYGWVLGPMYETRSEIKNMKNHGVNAVGMSTVPEVIMSKKLNLNLLVLSLMSNYAIGLTNDNLDHQTVLDNSIKYNQNFKLLLIELLSKI
tara:strand:+ start:5677 stop:6444 length:768 start_codon:yes stop_codon:yes gene_type:complete